MLKLKNNNNENISANNNYIILVILALLLALFLRKYIFINAVIPSPSMENTIMTGDLLFGSKLSYLNKNPERGDIIIFKYPDGETQKFIKRIIGLPGETIKIENAKIYVNGKPLKENYLKETWINATGPYEFQVPKNSYFVLGDNRNNSLDARFWNNTYVSKDKILAKAKFVYYPFNHMKIIQ